MVKKIWKDRKGVIAPLTAVLVIILVIALAGMAYLALADDDGLFSKAKKPQPGDKKIIGYFSINAEIQPGLIPGLEAGIYPMEIIDFAVGFLPMDTQNDDLARVDKYAPGPAEDDQPLSEESMETLPEDLQTLPENLNTLLESMEPLPHPGPAPVE